MTRSTRDPSRCAAGTAALAVLGLLAFLVAAPRTLHAGTPLKLAVLELRDSSLTPAAGTAYLADRVRGRASADFTRDELRVLTRESLELMLPAGRTLVECATGSCEVETGRLLGADYVLSGELLRFAGELRLLLKLHHCASATFLGSEPVAARDLRGLERRLEPAVSRLLTHLRVHAGLPTGTAPDTARMHANPSAVPGISVERERTGVSPPPVPPARTARDGAEPSGQAWTALDDDRDLDWYAAWRWCERCRAAGEADWRLPTIEELESLAADAGEPAATSLTRAFRAGTHRLWSVSMPRAGQAFQWDLARAARASARFADRRGARVLCVRGASE